MDLIKILLFLIWAVLVWIAVKPWGEADRTQIWHIEQYGQFTTVLPPGPDPAEGGDGK